MVLFDARLTICKKKYSFLSSNTMPLAPCYGCQSTDPIVDRSQGYCPEHIHDGKQWFCDHCTTDVMANNVEKLTCKNCDADNYCICYRRRNILRYCSMCDHAWCKQCDRKYHEHRPCANCKQRPQSPYQVFAKCDHPTCLKHFCNNCVEQGCSRHGGVSSRQ